MSIVEKITANNSSYEINDSNALQRDEVETIVINGNIITYNGANTQTTITYSEESPISVLNDGDTATLKIKGDILVNGSPVVTQQEFEPIESLKFSPLYMSEFANSVSYSDDFYDSHIKAVTKIEVQGTGINLGSLILNHEYDGSVDPITYTATFDGAPLVNKAFFNWSTGILTISDRYDSDAAEIITLAEPEQHECKEAGNIEIKKMPGENIFTAEERDTVSVGWDYGYQARHLAKVLRAEFETEIEHLRESYVALEEAWSTTYLETVNNMIKNQLSAMPTIWYGTNLNDFSTIPTEIVDENQENNTAETKPKPGDLFVYITGNNSTPDSSTDYYVRRAQLPELVDEIMGDIADGSY